MIHPPSMASATRSTHARTASKCARDPYLEDCLASATAVSLDLSVSGLKHLAKAGGISRSRASRWRSEGKGNPLFEVTSLVFKLMAAGQHAGVLAAHILTTLHQAVMPLTEEELIDRFWLLMGLESEAEGRENHEQAMFAFSGDLEGLEKAALDEAGLQHELAATIRELRRRKIDPRKGLE